MSNFDRNAGRYAGKDPAAASAFREVQRALGQLETALAGAGGMSNANQILGVPVDDAAKAGGKALVYNASRGRIEYQTLGGGGAPDPTAWDDEFDAASLDAKWAWVNQAGATATLANGKLDLTSPPPPVTGDWHVRMILQSVPTGNDWTFGTEMELISGAEGGVYGAYQRAGLILRDSTTGKLALFYYDALGANSAQAIHSYASSPTSFWSNPAYYGFNPIERIYLRLQRSRASLRWAYSLDNGVWSVGGTLSWAEFATAGFDQVGLFVDTVNLQATTTGRFSWFRRIS